jgi:phosphopantothenoylcysteine decarboxylase/phosphopantothenate--cysteine ligase
MRLQVDFGASISHISTGTWQQVCKALNESHMILLGITGSIAAYRSLELIRNLRTHGHDVHAIPTRSALDFVTPLSLQTFTGQADIKGIQHIELAYNAKALLIAPATANTLAKMTHGLADNLLLETYLSFRGPILIAPAMETYMWEHPATQSNIATLRQRGVIIIEPEAGLLASGRSGTGRMASLDRIVHELHAALTSKDFADKKVLVTAGPTREYLDPVRYMSNASSGRMGVELVRELAYRGAEVTLVHGPLEVDIPALSNIRSISVTTAQDMLGQCLEYSPQSDIAILCAAVADYRPACYSETKIKKLHASLRGAEGDAAIHLVATEERWIAALRSQ